MKKSRKTTTAGFAALLAGGVLVAADALGWTLSPILHTTLLGVLVGAVGALGLTARDDDVTSEGTSAHIRKRCQ